MSPLISYKLMITTFTSKMTKLFLSTKADYNKYKRIYICLFVLLFPSSWTQTMNQSSTSASAMTSTQRCTCPFKTAADHQTISKPTGRNLKHSVLEVRGYVLFFSLLVFVALQNKVKWLVYSLVHDIVGLFKCFLQGTRDSKPSDVISVKKRM